MQNNPENFLTWETIDYTIDLPDSFLVPEHHWSKLMSTSLNKSQRIRLNHFLTYFMCEMFIHFEKSIISYIEYNKNRILEDLNITQIDKFVQEEYDHIKAFQRLAKIIRPDLYSEKELLFLKDSKTDLLVLKYTPLLPFFMMAFLFEEMTLFVSEVMEEKLEESWKPVFDVMTLHAKEEKEHIGLDRKIVESRIKSQNSIRTTLEVNSVLPLIAYSDKKVQVAWKKASKWFAEKENLTQSQKKEIASKGLSKSDILGMQSFVTKLKKRSIPKAGLLCYILSKISK